MHPLLSSAVQEHRSRLSTTTLRELFAGDAARAERMSARAGDLYLDFSKNLLDAPALDALLDIARECGVVERTAAMFAGARLNATEDRAVLHVALRRHRTEPLVVDGEDVVAEVHHFLTRMTNFTDKVRSGQWRGATGERITHVVNIGIGGSDLGPRMVVRALRQFVDDTLEVRFVANVDGADLAAALAGLDPLRTLFIVCSKTFTTPEDSDQRQSCPPVAPAGGRRRAGRRTSFRRRVDQR